ncbi:MAG: autotransporter-associated beta strand repeat-containing protein, partial [Thermoguttaceae bacterium]
NVQQHYVTGLVPGDTYDLRIYQASSAVGGATTYGLAYSVVPPPPTLAFWASAIGGSWSISANWTGGVPNADGAAAMINVPTNSPLTVTLDAPQTIGTLVLGSGNPGVGYTLSGSGGNTLTFSNTSNNAPAQISVIDGTHLIGAPVVLASNLVVTSTSSNPWTLSFGTASSITDNGNNLSLTMSASNGTLILSGADNYTGGTIVTAGTLIVASNAALPDGSSLTVGAGGTFVFDPSPATSSLAVSPAAVAVPEPSTLALLSAGAIGLMAYGRRRRRQVM